MNVVAFFDPKVDNSARKFAWDAVFRNFNFALNGVVFPTKCEETDKTYNDNNEDKADDCK